MENELDEKELRAYEEELDDHLNKYEYYMFYEAEFGSISSPLLLLNHNDPKFKYFNCIPDYCAPFFVMKEGLVAHILAQRSLSKTEIALSIGNAIIKTMEERHQKDQLIKAVLNPLVQKGSNLYFNEKPGFANYVPEAVAILFTKAIAYHKNIKVCLN